jgi:hypothetical protein
MTTVSETLGLGTMEYVHITQSGTPHDFEIRRVPIPAPVPPLREGQASPLSEALAREIIVVVVLARMVLAFHNPAMS